MSTPDLLFTPSPYFKKKRGWTLRRHPLPVLLLVLLIVLLAGIGGGTWFLVSRSSATSSVVGQIAFLSSDQTKDSGSQGSTDTVQIDLRITQEPSTGKSYYAWLLSDKDDEQRSALFLGTLVIHGETGRMVYSDPHHTNLLANNSRLLITEQDASPTPHLPSPDKSDWRYLAQIPQTLPPGPGKQYSLLDHLRHLLAEDPTLKAHGLSGGLANWLYSNTGVVYTLSAGAKDGWHTGRDADSALIRSHLIQILAYLDGASYVARDLPATTTIPVQANPTGSIGLLEYEAGQNPAGYLKHVALHINGVASAPGSSASLRKQAAQITTAISYINAWLEKVRQDTRKLVVMTDQQLQQPEAGNMLDDIALNATLAYNGQGARQEGVQWAYLHIQRLTMMNITVA
jgi:hypothetical protein